MRGELFIAATVVVAATLTTAGLIGANRSNTEPVSDFIARTDHSAVETVHVAVPHDSDFLTVEVPGGSYTTEEDLVHQAAIRLAAERGGSHQDYLPESTDHVWVTNVD